MSESIDTETPEQAERRIRLLGSQKALALAPSVIGHVRGLILTSDGRTEAGEVIRTDRTPLHTGKVDDADEAFTQLVDWVSFWAETLNELPPTTTGLWRPREDVIGFPAATTAERATMTVRLQTMWLLARHERIALHPSAEEYQRDVMRIVFSLRATYPTTAIPERLVHPRPCPDCGEPAVHAEWKSGDETDVEIRCEVCGYEIEKPTPREISRCATVLAIHTPASTTGSTE